MKYIFEFREPRCTLHAVNPARDKLRWGEKGKLAKEIFLEMGEPADRSSDKVLWRMTQPSEIIWFIHISMSIQAEDFEISQLFFQDSAISITTKVNG